MSNINWNRIKTEISRLSDIEELKKELLRLREEIKKFDIPAHLSPSNQARLKNLEQKYNELLKTVGRTQRQFDVEFNKALRMIKKTRDEVEKGLHNIKVAAISNRSHFKKKARKLKKKASTQRKTKSASTGN